jgi:hypothetical protein
MKYLILIASLLTSINAFASKSEFCTGFEEGYKSIRGDMVLVPLCPLEPLTPMGSTPFREGIKAGIRAAS